MFSGMSSFFFQRNKSMRVSMTYKRKFLISDELESKSLQAINAGEGVEKREPSYTVGGNADWYSHYGKQCGDFLKNWK